MTEQRALSEQTNLAWAQELAARAEALRNANGGHWGEVAGYPIATWQQEVEGFDTRLGYWEWVANAQEPAGARANG